MHLVEAERVQGELVAALEDVHPDAEAGDTVELWMTDDERFCPEGRDWYASREAFLAACGRLPCSAPVVLARVGTAGLLGPLPRWAVEVTAYCDDNHQSDHPWAWVREGEIEHLDPTDDDLEQWRIEAGAGGDQETVAAITAWLDGDRSLDVAIIVADTVRQVEAWQDERAAEQGRART
jgi:hypothetical protein